MSDPEPVRACICYPHSFAEIKRQALSNGWTTVPEITQALGCGSGCGLCRPFLTKMLKTGRTSFAAVEAVDDQE